MLISDRKRITDKRIKLTILVRLGNNLNLVGHQVGGVETNTELTNHRDIRASGQSLHELLGARASNGTQVVDKIGLRETDTSINAVGSLLVPLRQQLEY
jgi:hypothetical protein